ncbi:hypothetical protein [Paracoccus sp. pheM1]|uniref:hypothetical protein n=1 Tax=Paracoccus sp. pheM1 TaxID=2831675 RepID=UPI001BDB8BA0|nr:hypothetical protein [Paracoccus sp. pheM1]MBT0780700.1 hypothetical protein [Paracoccus sp. pheM1]
MGANLINRVWPRYAASCGEGPETLGRSRARTRQIDAAGGPAHRGGIRALKEANARLSIAPLLNAGEFSTISENLTEADVAIRETPYGQRTPVFPRSRSG